MNNTLQNKYIGCGINKVVLSFSIIMVLFMLPYITQAQTTIVPQAGVDETFMPITGDTFHDPGGPGGNCGATDSGVIGDYPNCGCVTNTTLCAPSGENITVTFTEFRVFGTFDWLVLFDGNSTPVGTNAGGSAANPTSSDPELYSSLDGDELVDMPNGGEFTSTGECITFSYRFSGVVNTCGWDVEISGIDGGGNPDPGTSNCSVVCIPDQVIQLSGGECVATLPVTYSLNGACVTSATVIEGFTGPFDLSSASEYDTPNGFTGATDFPTVYAENALQSTFGDAPNSVNLIHDNPSGADDFIIYAMQMPYAGILNFDYNVGGEGSTWQVAQGVINNIVFAQSPNVPGDVGSLTLELAEDEILYFWLRTPLFFHSIDLELSGLTYTAAGALGEDYVESTVYADGVEVSIFPGEDLEVGEYSVKNVHISTDGLRADSCEVSISVLANPVVGGSLTCNDGVNISVDELCSVYMNADMFLEGSNYACYNDLIINIWVYNDENTVVPDVNGQIVDFTGLSGEHTFEVVNPVTGNKCWGNFTIEDKIAPTPECPCTEVAVEELEISGSIDADSPTFTRWGGSINQGAACFLAAANTYRYDVVPFMVSVDGFYQLDGVWPGDSHGAVFEGSFDPDNACLNLVESNDDSNGGLDPQITVNLLAGVQYFYVMTTFSSTTTDTGVWTVTVNPVSDGAFLVGDPACVFKCTDIDLVLNSTDLTPNPDFDNSDNCGIATADFADALTTDDCGTSTIVRRWTFSDAMGNTSTCEQIFTFNVIGLGDVIAPLSPIILTCGADVTPAGIAALLGPDSGYPHVITQNANGDEVISPIVDNICNIYTTYTDLDLSACGEGCYGNRKVLRTWTIFDWCAQESTTESQIIKAIDEEGPTFNVEDVTVSTRPWDCTANFTMPDVWELHDNCDDNPYYEVTGPVGVVITPNYDGTGALVNYTVSGAPKGSHTFTYTAYDCCGNATSVDATVTVEDKVGPVVTTKQDIVVSLVPAGENGGEYDGQAKIFPYHVDNGSYDMCTDVHLEIRRPSGSPACENYGINGYNNNVTFNNDRHIDDNNSDTDGGQFVKFCCEDVDAIEVDANGDGVVDALDRGYVEVILRVWDDADMDGSFGSAGDNYNESWAFVKVENKLPPVLVCPEDATIYCDWPIDLSTDFGGGFQDASQANFEGVGSAEAYGICGAIPVTFRDSPNLNQCGIGVIRRTWRASVETASGPKVVTCIQTITVEERASSFEVNAPSQDHRDWDSCVFDETMIPDSHKPRVTSGACDVVGENIKVDTFLFEDGVCKKWAVTYKYFNWCTDEEWPETYTVYYFFDDQSKPELSDCDDQMIEVDGNCQALLTVSNTATDNGGCTDGGWLKWQVFVDTWADGLVEYYGNSYLPKRSTWTPVPKFLGNGALNPAWAQLPSGQNYADVVYTNGIGSTVSGQEMVVELEVIEGSMSNHKVTWKVTDGCHNFATCKYDVMVVDKKAPTPYCVDLSTALMINGMVELWAVDFDKGAFDNCTPQDWLAFSFYGAEPQLKDTLIVRGNNSFPVNRHVPHYFDENNTFVDFDSDGITPWTNGIVYPKTSAGTLSAYGAGLSQDGTGVQVWRPLDRSSGAVFTQAGVWSVNVSVWDEKCNTEYCTVTLSINTPSGVNVGGRVATSEGSEVPGVVASIMTPSLGEYPKTDMTTDAGEYMFNETQIEYVYTLSATKEENFRSGLSTIDLVKIQRHILGTSPFTDAYSVIAADVNGNESVEPTDILVLRKLILNIQDEVAGNTSWKFVDAKQEFADVLNPWPINESVSTGMLVEDMEDVDFVAVKIGDINQSIELRNSTPVVMMTEDREVSVGESVSVEFTSSDYAEVYGTQFTMEHSGLRFAGIEGGALRVSEVNVGLISDAMLTMSATAPAGLTAGSTEGIFTINFVAERSGLLSEMVRISSRSTEAEVYVGTELEIRPIELSFRNGVTTEIAFELLQNEPNPFKANTTISYVLPEAGEVQVTILDVTGKVIMTRKVEGTVGMNTLSIDDNDVRVSGVLYYQVESGDYTATKKMISIK